MGLVEITAAVKLIKLLLLMLLFFSDCYISFVSVMYGDVCKPKLPPICM